jgi:ferritin
MSSWSTYTGYTGLAKLMSKHTKEEGSHMEKLYDYMLERQVNPVTPAVKQQPVSYRDLKDVLEKGLAHEELIENTYKAAVKVALSEGDHTSYTFLQWFLKEQVEEIDLFSGWLDRLNIVGCDQKGMYFIDSEIAKSL